jgi:polar amino acid transport system substrate-binding protein
MKKTGIVKSAVLCAALACAMTAGAETLRFAAESSYAPFIFVDSKSGNHAGFEVDLMKLIGKKLGAKIEIINMGFDAVIPSLVTGTVDIGGSAITITEERAKRVNFTTPYYDSGLSILINKSDENSIKGIEDLAGKDVCVQIGTSGAERAGKIKDVKLHQFNAVNEAYLELQNMGCRAVITDRPVTAYFLMQRKGSAKRFVHLPKTLDAEQFGFAVTKKKPRLVARLNKVLADLHQSGEFKALFEKWFGVQ